MYEIVYMNEVSNREYSKIVKGRKELQYTLEEIIGSNFNILVTVRRLDYTKVE